MNYKISYDHGYLVDLLYICSLHFNEEYHIKNDSIEANSSEERERIGFIKQIFGKVDPSLGLFFTIQKNGRCFMTSRCFSGYGSICSTEYNVSTLLNDIKNIDEFNKKLFFFYFPETEEKEEYPVSLDRLSCLIDTSSYSELTKRQLYSFFINPENGIFRLTNALTEKESLLRKYYINNKEQTEKFQNEFSQYNSAIDDICRHLNVTLDDANKGITVSPCLLNENCIWAIDSAEYIFILGKSFRQVIHNYKNAREQLDMTAFGDIFSEANRIEILRFMVEKKEITIKDIEKQFNITGSTAYYHITMMQKENMISTRNKGRTVLYSINSVYFKKIINQLQEFI